MILAIFDFDSTLTKKDTFVPFTMFVVGMSKFIYGVSLMIPTLVKYKLGLLNNNVAKRRWIKFFL